MVTLEDRTQVTCYGRTIYYLKGGSGKSWKKNSMVTRPGKKQSVARGKKLNANSLPEAPRQIINGPPLTCPSLCENVM